MLSVCTLGRSAYRWKGFEIEMRLLPSLVGQTRFRLVPLGEVTAHTHGPPVALIASLEQVQVEELQKFLAAPLNSDARAKDFEKTARASLQNFVIRQFLLGALGGLLAPILFHSRRTRFFLIGPLLGSLSVGVVVGSMLTTFNGKAFENPTYTGALRHAAWAVKFGKDAFVKFEELSGQLRTIAQNLNTLYGRIDAVSNSLMPDEGADTFRVLHVSDIHNNPAAFSFLREVAHQFQVDFIVDTGDLTDFGSPLEATIGNEIRRLPYPYVIVLGNHDSPVVASALGTIPNVTLLDGKPMTIHGVTLVGIPNPAATRQGMEGVNASPEEMQQNESELLRIVQGLPEPPDIVAVHDPRQSELVWGRVPLVLCGHMHRLYTEEQTAPPPGVAPVPASPPTPPAITANPEIKTIICNAGTTGAAGTRYFNQPTGVALTCAVLTFRRPAPRSAATEALEPAPVTARPKLHAITLITLDGSLNQYSLSRRTYAAPALPTSTAPALTPPSP
jgi:predicted phosphodiesterase